MMTLLRDGALWVAKLRNRIEKHEAGTPQFRLNLWRQAFDTSSYQESFHPPQEKVWTYNLPATVDITVERACSKSYIAVLSDDQKSKVVDDVKAILEEGEGKVWTDENQGVFEYPYKCCVVVSHKK